MKLPTVDPGDLVEPLNPGTVLSGLTGALGGGGLSAPLNPADLTSLLSADLAPNLAGDLLTVF